MLARDQDLLDKLFDVESKAESLVADARKEADRRIAAAKGKAEADYSSAYDIAVKEANARKEAAAGSAVKEYESAVDAFKAKLDATRVDQAAFKAICESALAKK